MTRSEYRQLPRITAKVPIEVEATRPGKLHGQKELCTSENVSAAGICFLTRCPLAVGTYVRMLFMMPQEVSRWAARPYQFTGKVLRVEPIGGSEEQFSVAVMLTALADTPANRPPRASAPQGRYDKPALCA
jgi:PilZ domain